MELYLLHGLEARCQPCGTTDRPGAPLVGQAAPGPGALLALSAFARLLPHLALYLDQELDLLSGAGAGAGAKVAAE